MKDFWQKCKLHKKWVIAILLILTLTTTGIYVYLKKNSTPVAADTVITVNRADIQSTVSATGTISAVNSVSISSRVTGLITEVKVKENDAVKAGQVLVVLDDTSLKAQVAQYEAQLINYAAIYERNKKLAAIEGVSIQDLDASRTNYLVAKATYDNYASQLEYYVIKSPIDGTVIGKPTSAGQTVAQGISEPQVIMTVADMSRMQVKVLVDETDIGKVKVEQIVSFTVDAYANKTFTGKATIISKDATTSSNVVYYKVYVDVDTPEGLLFPTMTARVTIIVAERKNVLVVPVSAIIDDKGQKYVQLTTNGKKQNVLVQLGLSNDEKVEITSGLSEGSQILLPADKPKTTTNQNQGPPTI